jgi:hypothetical protein
MKARFFFCPLVPDRVLFRALFLTGGSRGLIFSENSWGNDLVHVQKAVAPSF